MENEKFANKYGAIVAIAASAVGLGNIWRFPYVAGENGGAIFILIYIAVTLLISAPLLISKLTFGRATQSDVVKSYDVVESNKLWGKIGYLGLLSVFAILCFYSVVGGWSMKFMCSAFVNNGFSQLDIEASSMMFDNFVHKSYEPIIWTIIYYILTFGIVLLGVKKGIGKFTKYTVPLILGMILFLIIYSVGLSGFSEAFNFLFYPDFSAFTLKTVALAAGQSFMSLSIGAGMLITYAAYVKKDIKITSVVFNVVSIDTMVAILAGLTIFPIVFTYGFDVESGVKLVFITLPTIFSQMPFANILAPVFFSLLFLAALTSSISLFEVPVKFLMNACKISRKTSAIILLVIFTTISIFVSMSQVEGSSILISGKNLFDIFNNLSAYFFMPISALAAIIFIGWKWGKDNFIKEITINGTKGLKFYSMIFFMVKYILPVALAFLTASFMIDYFSA